MNELTRVEKVFEGRALTAYLWEGAPVWIAKEVGKLMGYRDEGRGLVDQLRDGWKEEIIDGKDVELLEGPRLAKFKTDSSGNIGQVDRSPSLLLLKESGFHLVCLKTDKPVGRRLRRWLSDEVFPELHRTGSYQAKPPGPKELPEPPRSPSAREVFEEYKPAVLAAVAKKAAEGNLEAAHMYLSLGKSSSSPKNTGETPLSKEEGHPTKTSQIEALLLFGAKPPELLRKGFSKTLVYAVYARLRARNPATN